MASSAAIEKPQTSLEKRWISDVAFLRRFDRRHPITAYSAKTYGKPARRTSAEKRVTFRGVLKRHLSVVLRAGQETVE
jgi:hypothetical protein